MRDDLDQHMVFVCTGNTCRSPMAEVLMRHLCRSVSGWTFSSAGIFTGGGSPANEMAIRAVDEKGLDLTPHRSRALDPAEMQTADWLIAMTAGHRDWMLDQVPHRADRIRTLHSFGSASPGRDVMDPIGGSFDTYRVTRDEIESALTDLILTVIQPTSST